MRELALNILDIAENSLAAGAKHIEIGLTADFSADTMRIIVADDGCGMDEDNAEKGLTDPFTTSRKTRSVGMGLPLFKYSAESAGGEFQHLVGKGARVRRYPAELPHRAYRPYAARRFRRRRIADGHR